MFILYSGHPSSLLPHVTTPYKSPAANS